MIETLRLWWNKARIFLLSKFTNRVKKIVIQDEQGKEHEVTIEKNVEKVCAHKNLKQIATTMWACSDCDDAYFQINYKVQLTPADMGAYLTELAEYFKLKLADKPDESSD